MKVILIGTEHDKEEEIEVIIEKPLVEGDDWTFTVGGRTFTISGLTAVMDFLKD
jgi:hypothetical protein